VSGIRRREFVSLLGGSAAAAWALAARAQQPAIPRVGWLNAGSREGYGASADLFNQHLKGVGYVEGQNVTIEYRFANNQYERLPELLADLIQRQSAVIVANTTPAARAAKAATSTIPIVFAIAGDPLKLGLVASLRQPGGNLTGVSFLVSELVPKRLEVLREAVPLATLIGFLVNPSNPNTANETREVRAAAESLRQELVIADASSDAELELAFASLVHRQVGALLVASDPFFNSRRERLVALSSRHMIPTMYSWREFPAVGGLMSYGNSIEDGHRQVAHYVGRILRGEKVSDLPVVQSTKVELVINLTSAKALGFTFPHTLLGRVDEVIE
jgi:putative tryptophan/tyrosine transport system substrate-binding protein